MYHSTPEDLGVPLTGKIRYASAAVAGVRGGQGAGTGQRCEKMRENPAGETARDKKRNKTKKHAINICPLCGLLSTSGIFPREGLFVPYTLPGLGGETLWWESATGSWRTLEPEGEAAATESSPRKGSDLSRDTAPPAWSEVSELWGTAAGNGKVYGKRRPSRRPERRSGRKAATRRIIARPGCWTPRDGEGPILPGSSAPDTR